MKTFKDFVSNIEESKDEQTSQELNESELAQAVLSSVKSNELDKVLNKDNLYKKIGAARKAVDILHAFDMLLAIQELQMAMAAVEAGADKDKLNDQIQKTIKKVQIVLRDVQLKDLNNLGKIIEDSLKEISNKGYKI